MDLNKLYYFYVVAKHEHVTHASQELRIAQPALSRAIKLLEKDLGTALFYKQKRNIHLTPCGQHLKSRLDVVFSTLDMLPAELRQISNQTVATVRLNVLSASQIVTSIIAEYKASHKNVIFQVFQNKMIMDCDIFITTTPQTITQTYSLQKIIREKLYLAVPKESPFAEKDAVSAREVKDEWFIAVSDARPLRNTCDQICLRSGFKPNIIFESDSPADVRNLISAGAGIGFWPAFSFGDVSRDIKLLTLTDPNSSRDLVVSLHEKSANTEAALDFYHFLVEYLSRMAANSHIA